MSFGRLAATTITTAGTAQLIYTIPANCIFGEVNLDILNNQTSNAAFKLAVTTGGAPAAADYIEDGTILPANGGVMEKYNLVVSPGEKIYLQSSVAGVVVRVAGKLYPEVPGL